MIAVRKIFFMVVAQLLMSVSVCSFNEMDYLQAKDLLQPFGEKHQLDMSPAAALLYLRAGLVQGLLHHIDKEHPLWCIANTLFHEVLDKLYITMDPGFVAYYLSVEQIGQLLLLLADDNVAAKGLSERVDTVLQLSLQPMQDDLSGLVCPESSGNLAIDSFVHNNQIGKLKQLAGAIDSAPLDKLNGQYSQLFRALGGQKPTDENRGFIKAKVEEIVACAEAYTKKKDEWKSKTRQWGRRPQRLKQFADALVVIKTEQPLFVPLAQRVLLTFMWCKAKTKEAFAPYLQRAGELGYLETPMPERWQISTYERSELQAQLGRWNGLQKSMGSQEDELRSFLQDRELLIAGLNYEVNRLYPPLLRYEGMKKLGDKGDCVETMLRNMLNCLLFNPEIQELDVAGRFEGFKKEGSVPGRWELFSKFYRDFPTLAAQNTPEAREAWLDVMSGIVGAPYKQFWVHREFAPTFFSEMDKVIDALTGFSWQEFYDKYDFAKDNPPVRPGAVYQPQDCIKWCAPGAHSTNYLHFWLNAEGHGEADYIGKHAGKGILAFGENDEFAILRGFEVLILDHVDNRVNLLNNAFVQIKEHLHYDNMYCVKLPPLGALFSGDNAQQFAAAVSYALVGDQDLTENIKNDCYAHGFALAECDGRDFFNQKFVELLINRLRNAGEVEAYDCCYALRPLQAGAGRAQELFFEALGAVLGANHGVTGEAKLKPEKALKFCRACMVSGYGKDSNVDKIIRAFLAKCSTESLFELVEDLSFVLENPQPDDDIEAAQQYLALTKHYAVDALLESAKGRFEAGAGVVDDDPKSKRECIALAGKWCKVQKDGYNEEDLRRLRDGYLDVMINFFGLEEKREDKRALSEELKKHLPIRDRKSTNIDQFLRYAPAQGEAA